MAEAAPLLLTIDTSTRYAGVGLARGATLLAEYTWQAGINHTVQLLPVVKAVLQENGARLADVGVIAIACGPGSFNGLRVGMATAKGFCRTLGVPLVAVGTLEVEAYPHAAFPGQVCAVHDAGRGDLAWAMFTSQGDEGWRCTASEQITKPEELAKSVLGARATSGRRSPVGQVSNLSEQDEILLHRLSAGPLGPTLLCGEPPAWAVPALLERAHPHLTQVGAAASLRRPASLAELAWLRHQAGDHADLEAVQPLYLRRPPGGA